MNFALLVIAFFSTGVAYALNENSPNSVCLYEDRDYRGLLGCYAPGEAYLNLRDRLGSDGRTGMQDRISSIRINGPVSIIVTEHGMGETGENQKLTLRQGIADLSAIKMNDDDSWNNRISGFTVAWDNAVCFFDDTNFRGQSLCLSPGEIIGDLDKAYVAGVNDRGYLNNRVQSVRFPRTEYWNQGGPSSGNHNLVVWVSEDKKFESAEIPLTRDSANLLGEFPSLRNNGISAIAVLVKGQMGFVKNKQSDNEK